MVKKRIVALGYLLVLVTLGLYSFVWLFTMMKDINSLERKTIFSPVKTSIPLCLYYLMLHSINLFESYAAGRNLFANNIGVHIALYFILTILALGWFYLIVTAMVKIGKALSQLQARVDIQDHFSSQRVGFLTLLCLISFPYLQVKLNRIIEKTHGIGLTVA